jgi:hypothetical protein
LAFVAHFAIYPPKWQAAVRERPAELIFCIGELLGSIRRNDTTFADCSANAAAAFLGMASTVRYSRQKSHINGLDSFAIRF